MREPLKKLWDAIIDNENEDRLFDLVSLFSLIINKSISDDELQELREYAKGIKITNVK